jgi:quercetin dioxygenase-like cupin family protein
MSDSYTHFVDLAAEVEPPTDGTLSRTLYHDERLKVVLFGFSAGQELSEHTAGTPAIMHIIQGEAAVTLGSNGVRGRPGTWIHMPANLTHSIRAETPMILLLLLLK